MYEQFSIYNVHDMYVCMFVCQCNYINSSQFHHQLSSCADAAWMLLILLIMILIDNATNETINL